MPSITPVHIVLGRDIQIISVPPVLDKLLTSTLEIPNPKWIENNRMGRWNQQTPKTLCFYSRTDSGGLRIPRGYMGRLIRSCRQYDIAYVIKDRRRTLSPVNFTFSGALKSFQDAAVNALQEKHFGTLAAPTGSGKTIMAIAMIAIRRQPALVIVHTRELAAQWIQRLETFLGIEAADIGMIGGGKKKVGAEITVALVQSLYKCAEEISPQVGFLIVDECHRCPSRTFTEAVSFFDAQYMLGLSATPWRRDNLSNLIFWHLGDIQYAIDKKALVATGDILDAKVTVRQTEFRPHHDPTTSYSKMLAELTADDRRNHMIAADVAAEAEKADGICLVLSDRKHHCETLKAILTYRYKIAAEVLTGDVDIRERAEILKRLSEGHVRVLIATGQLIGEGFDCPNLSTLFLTTPVRFSGRVLQYIGRVLRPSPGKAQAQIFDYVDGQVGVLQAAANARQAIYSGGY